jgi:two-component system OmpR family sensor kinase
VKQISINRKLYYRISLTVIALWLGAVISVMLVVRYETNEIFDSSLQELSQRLLTMVVRELKTAPADDSQVSDPVDHEEYMTYQVFDVNGRMRIRSHKAPEQAFSVPKIPGFYVLEDQHIYVDMSKDKKYVIQVAEPPRHRNDTLNNILRFMILAMLLLLPFCIYFIHLAVREVKFSIQLFSNKIAARSSQDLRPLDRKKFPIELHNLVLSVNSLMARLKITLDVERSIASNSAHELRTPIAAAIGQLNILKATVTENVALDRINDALIKMKRLEQTAIKLLQMAKVDSGVGYSASKVNLSKIFDLLHRDLSYKSEREIKSIFPENHIWVSGDMDAIGIAVENLFENANKYATPGTPIFIELQSNGILSVKNDHDPIPEALLMRLTERFVRAEKEKSGSGIGLAIVEKIIAHCGGSLILRSPCFENGRGFEVQLNFIPWHRY